MELNLVKDKVKVDPEIEKTIISSFDKEKIIDVKNIIPEAIVNLRYYSKENFIGEVITGYEANVAYLKVNVAQALKRVADKLKAQGYNIVIYDTYRPFSAVKHFVRWGNDEKDLKMKDQYYPYVDKKRIFELGYLGIDSKHCRADTIDLTIIPIGQSLKNKIEIQKRKLTDGAEVLFLDDGTCDMFTSFDYFGKASHSNLDNNLIPDLEALKRRKILQEAMVSEGFEIYSMEWWHFHFKGDFKDPIERYDFPIKVYPK